MTPTAPNRHLAQINIGRLVADKDDPRVAEFMDNLERVNRLAERSPGYVWRFTDDTGVAATEVSFDGVDPRYIANLSVWESAEALEAFVFNTLHRRFYAKRAAWFEPLETPHFAMWWVAPGHRPSLEEGRARLERLRAEGPSEHAFGWSDLADARLWRERRCA